jgi:hypothetical protein
MSHKLFIFPFLGTDYKIWLKEEHYASNGNLALQAYTDEGEPFAMISTNVEGALTKAEGKDHICLDDNNLPIKSFDNLMKAGALTPTGRYAQSGFCNYPIYKVDLTKI